MNSRVARFQFKSARSSERLYYWLSSATAERDLIEIQAASFASTLGLTFALANLPNNNLNRNLNKVEEQQCELTGANSNSK